MLGNNLKSSPEVPTVVLVTVVAPLARKVAADCETPFIYPRNILFSISHTIAICWTWFSGKSSKSRSTYFASPTLSAVCIKN